ncbi:hypothetical protein KJY77_01170 [Canibacter sp. lx-72]|uniref:hypothetical protein n=1 Tax=Canibacter zhuwentaonis TaxID=2837491 RepID=UPI001BDD60C8|nr:hypothetical protein [Canibacter zhuwentaonis]MBT1017754.1 hypothetical protein [Canibacter zhuwentaonis]
MVSEITRRYWEKLRAIWAPAPVAAPIRTPVPAPAPRSAITCLFQRPQSHTGIAQTNDPLPFAQTK